MTYKCNTFSGGSAGTTITAGNTGFVSVTIPTGATAKFDAGSAEGTPLGILLTSGSANAGVSIRNTFATSDVQQRLRESFTIDASSYSAEMRFLNLRTGTNAATNANVYLTLSVTKKLKLYDATGVAGPYITTSALPPGEYDYLVHATAATTSTGRVIVEIYAKGSNSALYSYDSGTTLNLGTTAFTGYDAGLISPTAESHTYRMCSPQNVSDSSPPYDPDALIAPIAVITSTGTLPSYVVSALDSTLTAGVGALTNCAIAWDFGDGTTATNTTGVAGTYATPGVYTVTLTITDPNGLVGFASIVLGAAPTAAFTSSISGLTVSVDGTGSISDNASPLASYDYDWGDGTSHGSTATASHTYALPGSYLITLTVTDTDGVTDPQVNTVVVTAPTVITDPGAIPAPYSRWQAWQMFIDATPVGDTSINITTAFTPLTQAPGAYPMDIIVEAEIMTITAPPSSAVSPQTVTVLRGQEGTPEAAHGASTLMQLWPTLTWAL